MIVFSGCFGENTTKKNKNGTLSSKIDTSSKVNGTMIYSDNDIIDNYINEYSDGIIEPMSIEELIEKLSMLNEKTTMVDVVEIFGKTPCLPMMVSVDVFYYYCGDIQINIWGGNYGETIYRVEVIYNESMFTVNLQDDFKVQE